VRITEARTAARTRVSEDCAALFIARATTDVTIAELAASVGISERTFYRYFPIKAECVGPLFDWTTSRFDEAVAEARAGMPVREILLAAFRAGLGGPVAERTWMLFPLVFADPEMWSVFLRKVHDGERSLAPVLAPRLGLEAGSASARAAAAAVASATRIALEAMVTTGTEPEAVYTETIDAFASGAIRQR
jgi:TetR/AcrR family transcriptional regulator, regulator of mycofactocin system